MKPLIRWIVGPVKQAGLDILKLSITSMQKLYPECDFVISHNQLNNAQESFLQKLNIPLQEQIVPDVGRSPEQGYNVHWKLYPPRLDIQRHELCMDNDIIINDRLEEIDKFFQDDAVLMYQGLHGFYGMYRNDVPRQSIFINSGIYGVPPNFDMTAKVKKVLGSDKRGWLSKFDEQGLIASLLVEYGKHYIIPLTSISIVEVDTPIELLKRNCLCKGFHFVEANIAERHVGWESYIKNYEFSSSNNHLQ